MDFTCRWIEPCKGRKASSGPDAALPDRSSWSGNQADQPGVSPVAPADESACICFQRGRYYSVHLGWLWEWRSGAAQECCVPFAQKDRSGSGSSSSFTNLAGGIFISRIGDKTLSDFPCNLLRPVVTVFMTILRPETDNIMKGFMS